MASIPNWPTIKVQVDFVTDPNGPSAGSWVWTDVTADVVGFGSARGRQYELGAVEAGTGSIRLDNRTGKYSAGGSLGVKPLRAARVTAQVGAGPVSPIGFGYIERWPSQAVDPSLAWADVVLVDGFEPLAQLVLRSAYEQEVLADNPVGYFPLQESGGATTVANLVDSTAPGVVVQSKGVAVGSTNDVKLGTGLPLLDTTSGAGLSASINANTLPQSASIKLPPACVVGASSPWSIECWVQLPTNGSSNAPPGTGKVYQAGSIFAQFGRSGRLGAAGPQSVLLIANASDSVPANKLDLYLPGATADAYSTTNMNDGMPHHVVVVWPGGTAGVSLYVDGALQGTTPGPVTYATVPQDLWIGPGILSDGQALNGLTVVVAHFAVYQQALTGARVQAHYQAGLPGWVGETADVRITRALGYSDWQLPTALSGGDSALGPAKGWSGKTVLDVCRDSAASDQGVFIVSPGGVMTFKSRSDRLGTLAPAWVFGGNTGAGELPYREGPTFDYDPTYVANDVQVQNSSTGALARVIDTASQQSYFTRSLPTSPLQLSLAADTEAAYAAQWLLSRYRQPQTRVQSLILDPSAYPSLWTCVTTVDVGDRVRINHRTTGGGLTTIDGFVERVEHKVSTSATDASWVTTLQVSPLFGAYWLLAALHTTVKNAAASGVTSIVLNPLPDAAVNAAEASLPVGGQLVLGIGTGAAQTVTIASVTSQPTARTAGYTSVLVGLTAATTQAVTVGEVATEPLPAGVTDPTTYDARSVLGSTTLTAY